MWENQGFRLVASLVILFSIQENHLHETFPRASYISTRYIIIMLGESNAGRGRLGPMRFSFWRHLTFLLLFIFSRKQSFHFGPRVKGETFMESIKRAEYYLALRAGMNPKTKAIDIGCGVGGPMRNIQQFTGADITGVTINEYQVKVGNQYCAQKGIDKKCRIVQGDFQKLEDVSEKETYDVAFAIEATCHSPDRVRCFKGVANALKKGGLFTGYDWVVLPEKGFDAKNPDHLRIKEGIEVGNGLPTLATGSDVVKALEDAGFEVLDHFDANAGVHSPYEVPWYETLDGKFTLSGFRMTRIGRITTHCLVSVLEFLGIAPKGTVRAPCRGGATVQGFTP